MSTRLSWWVVFGSHSAYWRLLSNHEIGPLFESSIPYSNIRKNIEQKTFDIPIFQFCFFIKLLFDIPILYFRLTVRHEYHEYDK